MKKKAFTLIELIIVVAIIIVITVSSAIYFSRQISGLRLQTKLEFVADIIEKLDSKVENNTILDYRVSFSSLTSRYQSIIYSTNNVGIDYVQNIVLDSSNGYGTLSTSVVQSNLAYFIKIYSGVKFLTESLIDGTDSYSFNFNKSDQYRVSSTLSGTILNEIGIQYYGFYGEEYAKLLEINSLKDRTGTVFNTAELINIAGEKQILGDGIAIAGKSLYLFFEDEGGESFIEITK